jgi:hypothetical protein
MVKGHPETKVELSDLRKFTQILVTNSYSMTQVELVQSIGLLIGIARNSKEKFLEFSRYIPIYLSNYAF